MDHALACAGPPPPTEQTRGTQNPGLGGRRREGSLEPRRGPPSAPSALGAAQKYSLTLFPLFPHLFPMKWWDRILLY